MNTKSIIFILLTATALIACERDADIDLPDVPSKQVLNCYISPGDSVVTAFLSSSNPVNKPSNNFAGYNPLTGAEMYIGDGSQWIQMPYDEFSGRYRADVTSDFFIPGKTYVIKSEHPDFEDITARTVLPQNTAGIENAMVDFVENQGIFEPEMEIRFSLDILDTAPDAFNYYRVAFHDLVVTENQETYKLLRGNHYTDDARLIDGRISVSSRFFYDTVWGLIPQATYIIDLLTVNEDYYRYHKTMEQGDNSGGPFTEPVIVYSNVENGLGCFGGYLQASVTIEN